MVCRSSRWPNNNDTDFSTTESDQILTTSAATSTMDRYQVLINDDGNVLTQAENI